MDLPVIVVNFKTYANATGKEALELAKIHDKVAKETGASIAIAAQPVDLRMIVENVDIPVLAQHFDVVEEGAFTGHITPHSIKKCGAYGSLLNHAEKQMDLDKLQRAIDMARNLGLFTIVCADTAYSGDAIADLDPDLVAIEPPELIGGDVSVFNASPQIVTDAVQMIGEGKLLVGAGIKTKEDVMAAMKYGASGILLASGITKSLDPEKTLRGLVDGLTQKL